MDPATLASAASQFPAGPDSTRPSRDISRSSLPSMEIGYALSLLCLSAFVFGYVRSDKTAIGLANAFSLAGWVYWLHCTYRMHKVLAEATAGQYPISASRAVGFQMIPIYSLIWGFKWPKEIAKFLRQRLPDDRLQYGWVGVALVLAALLAAYPTGLHLALLFAAGSYLVRHLAKAVPWAVPEPNSRRQQIDLAYFAGLGAAWGFMFGQALISLIADLKMATRQDVLIPLIAIVLASGFAVLFLEPLAERCRGMFGISHEHFSIRTRSSRPIQIVLFLLLVITGASHDLLQDHIKDLLSTKRLQDSLKEDEKLRAKPLLQGIARSPMAQTVVFPLLFAGGITYFWVAGSRRSTMGAPTLGALSGVTIGVVVVLFIWGHASAANLGHLRLCSLTFVREIFSPGKFPPVAKLLTQALRGGSFGLLGGLAIQRQASGQRLRILYIVLIVSALLFGLLAHGFHLDLLKSLGFALGWCAGLFLHPHSVALLAGGPAETDPSSKTASAAA